ncbi:MAG: hypothetical protein JSS49_12025 [Planctomycetes bacterium]|nr:hypothetical protein [Planctomycetota bacterium]
MLDFSDANLLSRVGAALGCLLTVGTVPLLAVAIGRLALLRSPATRHAVLLTALLLVLASPLIALALQQAAIAIVAFPIPSRAMASREISESVQTIPQQFAPGGAAEELWGATSPELDRKIDSTVASTVSPAIPASRFAWLARLSELPLWARVGGIVWGLGSFALACDLLRCWRLIRRLRTTAQGIEVGGLSAISPCEPVLPSHVRLAEGDVPVPMVTGVWRPMILFPRGLLSSLTNDQMQDILTHELAHVNRRDNLVLWFEAAARILFWPIVTLHVLLYDLSQSREDACDNAVLVHRNPITYSETLLAVAQRCLPHRPLRLTSDAFQWRESLAGRVTRIIDQRRNLSTRPFWSAVGLSGVILVLMGVPLCGLAFVPDEKPSPGAPRDHVAQISDTMSVELVAIVPHMGESNLAWHPNGDPFREPPQLPAWDRGLSTKHFIGNAYDCVLKFNGVERERGIAYRTPWDMSVKNREESQFVRVACSDGGKSKDRFLTVGITDPEWGPVQKVNADGTIDAPVKVSAACRDVYEKLKPHHVQPLANEIRLCWTNHIENLAECEVFAIDQAGNRRMSYGSSAWNSGNDVFAAQIFNIPKSSIVGFEYRLRPYRYWVTFAPLAKSAGKIVATKKTVSTVAFSNENAGNAPVEATELTATEEFLERVRQTQRGPFGGNPIQKDQNGKILSLGLAEFQLKPGDAKTIAAMHELMSLDLRRSNVSDADLKELSGLTKLQRLNLWDAKITDAGIGHVTGMKSLKSLELGGTGLTDLGLIEVAKLSELVYLDLARTKIMDAGLEPLGGLNRLAGLKLSETSISDAGLVMLEKFASLNGVTLDETRVTAAGIARFAEHDPFQWMATDDGVANELARRQSAGDTEGCHDMLSIGLDLPHQGKFKTRSVTAHPVTEKDTERQRRRYRVEWDWENHGKPEGLFAELFIRQGTARVYEAGLLE